MLLVQKHIFTMYSVLGRLFFSVLETSFSVVIWFEKFLTWRSLLSLCLSLPYEMSFFPSALFEVFYHWLPAIFLYCVLALFYLLYLYCLSFTELLGSWIEFPPNLDKKCWSLVLQICILFLLLFQLWNYSILYHMQLAPLFQAFYFFFSSLFCILDSLLLWLYVHWCFYSAVAIFM